MSALTPITDVRRRVRHVRSVPEADMGDLEFIPTETLARGRRFVFVFAGANGPKLFEGAYDQRSRRISGAVFFRKWRHL